MSVISHHVPDDILLAYLAGTMGHAFDMVVAAHVSMCDECRARLGAHEVAGGLLLDDTAVAGLSPDLRGRVMAGLSTPRRREPSPAARGVYPAPVAVALKDRDPVWRPLGLGVRQSILHSDRSGSVRLLYIPPGQAVPDHGHNGLEMTLVLQGSFTDETGRFAPGDVEIADGDLEHTPVAGRGDACICLAATDAPLRFRGLIPRLAQPLFRI